MNGFQQAVANVLEVGEIGLDDEFRSVANWSSLMGFGLMVMMENDWEAPLDVDRFLAMSTVRDLYREAFLAFAAKLLGVSRTELSGDSEYGSVVQWDSVSHLRMVMEAEKRFGSYYPIEKIPTIRRIEDFLI